MIKPKYNEEKKRQPVNSFPKQPDINIKENLGAYARYKLEEVASFEHGINLSKLKETGIDPRDIIKYRKELQQAIRAQISEGRNIDSDSSRDVGIAYAGALGFVEDSEVFAGIASNPMEALNTRCAALDTLARIGGNISRNCILECLNDPHPVLQERAIRSLTHVGTQKDRELLIELINTQKNTEITKRASETIDTLSPLNPALDIPKPSKRKRRKNKMLEDASITRQIGKSNTG